MIKVILGIETSCDETGAAVLERKNGRIQILSNVVASSAQLQAKYGGIIPEQAAREQLKSIIPVIEESLRLASLAQGSSIELDAIAVTQGPGLIGSLLVGVETAKVLSLVWNKPLIAVNHLIGHFYANWITDHLPGVRAHLEGVIPQFPCIGLLVSGGHTDLVLFQDHGKYEYLGGTRDDAAGECFDKCARLLGLPYPGGPAIAAEAAKLKVKSENLPAGKAGLKVKLPRPMLEKGDFSAKGGPAYGWDFSFSGLKTAVLREVEHLKITQQFSNLTIQQLSYEIQQAIADVLVEKTVKAAQKYKIEQIMVAGGVAANQQLIKDLRFKIKDLRLKTKLHVPPPNLCTDNAAMIAAAAFFQKETANPLNLQANPNLSL
ncbi:tRNA (adenosine(37)-N6)-threonylcarbamoyltransferase complex transferase subunit TsaD [Candidatus Daviesbacteria bacterium RIFCSPHIGHO2_02_FULL_39_12]|uniref:tRNA N6-adenosine threonylcarbamoyltransferase n=1 Tax=Candidatus Daviesbacteria bacterium RIFCSPHIGHO2_02_FULL_39_12 TaxID=1797770 RepID=A0A1F5J8A3_9BACT|nr:MAG: tRNA (adenosine(37)-N6)-threonylcarbamoyltransferase complex transferase subunit TsaD [Candidatus Daviesbacteria bacterium RIFCSPHIGHO2_02_FULL_39_12]